MITKQTVFILGAGFSYELGMPLGGKLKVEIRAEALRMAGGAARRESDVTLDGAFGERGEARKNALRTIAAALDYHSSIDGLVEHFASSPDIALAARHLIADRILFHESKLEWSRSATGELGKTLRPMPQLHLVNHAGMKALFDLIVAGTSREDVEAAFEKVGFVNFNYDRTLEVYFYLALIERSDMDPARAARIVRSAKIWRPYGSVGRVNLQDREGAEPDGWTNFGARSIPAIGAAARSIRTYSEADVGQDLAAANLFMSEAATIAFLGCAYHSQNLALLERPREQRQGYPRIYGTHYAPPPADPDGHSTLRMDDFLAPARGKLSFRLWELLGPAKGGIQANVTLDSLTSRQLVEKYSPVWG